MSEQTGRSNQSSSGKGKTTGNRRCDREQRQKCKRKGKCLADLESGESGTIDCVGKCAREYLHSMGVRPGKRVEVHTKHPFGGPVVVSVGQSTVSLSRSHAKDLEVLTEG